MLRLRLLMLGCFGLRSRPPFLLRLRVILRLTLRLWMILGLILRLLAILWLLDWL